MRNSYTNNLEALLGVIDEEEKATASVLFDPSPDSRKRASTAKQAQFFVDEDFYLDKRRPWKAPEEFKIHFPTNHTVPEHLLEEFTYLSRDNYAKKEIESKNSKNRRWQRFLIPTDKIVGKWSEELVSQYRQGEWNASKLNKLAAVFLGKIRVTLSNLNWLCTNYAKEHGVRYAFDSSGEDTKWFVLNECYTQVQSQYERDGFDVFARKQRILIEYVDDSNDGVLPWDLVRNNDTKIRWDFKKQVGIRIVDGVRMVYLITSIGQVIFFGWASDNKVLDYFQKHREVLINALEKQKAQKKERRLAEKQGKVVKKVTKRNSRYKSLISSSGKKYKTTDFLSHPSEEDDEDREEISVEDKPIEEICSSMSHYLRNKYIMPESQQSHRRKRKTKKPLVATQNAMMQDVEDSSSSEEDDEPIIPKRRIVLNTGSGWWS
jgi:hypothetical protein